MAPLRDVLDRLEALRLLESADAWERIRAMRNALAHDYPESAEEKAATLNVAIEMAGQMDTTLQRLRSEAKFASVEELIDQFGAAGDAGYIGEPERGACVEQGREVARTTAGYIRFLERQRATRS